MSQENVELLRRAVDAFNRRDQDEFLALMDDEVEAHSRIVAVEGGYRGLEAICRWWDDFLGSFPDYTIVVEEARDLGNVVLCRFRARAHGAGSDTPLIDPVWHVTEWRDGKCRWWRVSTTEAEALEALGLRE
jgi:ketosteroid isomerase-like protein